MEAQRHKEPVRWRERRDHVREAEGENKTELKAHRQSEETRTLRPVHPWSCPLPPA